MLGAEAALEAVIKVVWGCSMLLNRGGGIWERDGSLVTPASRVRERPKCLNSLPHSRHCISLEKVTLVSRDHHVLRHSMMILMMMMMMMIMMIR